MRPIPLASVVGDDTRTPVRAAPGVRVTIQSSSACPYEIRKYTLPNGVGSITHFVAATSSNSRPNGPDDMFQQMQLGDFGLRRYPLQQSVGKCANVPRLVLLLNFFSLPVAGTNTAHFAANYVSGPLIDTLISIDPNPGNAL